MVKKIIVLILLVIFLTGCQQIPIIDDYITVEDVHQFTNETLPLRVASLPMMNMSSVENFEKYKSFADNTNDLIKILNEQSDLFNIPELTPTLEGWQKASRFITEYGPLINNYNEVVGSAKEFQNKSDNEGLKKFYIASGKFGFETAIIAGAVFYTAAYQGVGFAYRAVKLNKLAFKCGSCVSIILGNAHWFIRTVLVEGASQLAQDIANYATDSYTKNNE